MSFFSFKVDCVCVAHKDDGLVIVLSNPDKDVVFISGYFSVEHDFDSGQVNYLMIKDFTPLAVCQKAHYHIPQVVNIELSFPTGHRYINKVEEYFGTHAFRTLFDNRVPDSDKWTGCTN